MRRTKHSNVTVPARLPDAINCSSPINYTQIPNSMLRDPRLSAKAKGILALLLSNQEGKWVSYVHAISSMMADDVTSIQSGLRELESAGYLVRLRYREVKTKKLRGSIWCYTDTPWKFHIAEHNLQFLDANGLELTILTKRYGARVDIVGGSITPGAMQRYKSQKAINGKSIYGKSIYGNSSYGSTDEKATNGAINGAENSTLKNTNSKKTNLKKDQVYIARSDAEEDGDEQPPSTPATTLHAIISVEPGADPQVTRRCKQIYATWLRKCAHIHKARYTPTLEKAIRDKLKVWTPRQIAQAIAHYARVYDDSDFYYKHRWTLISFLTQSNGAPRFACGLDEKFDGDIWRDYLAESGHRDQAAAIDQIDADELFRERLGEFGHILRERCFAVIQDRTPEPVDEAELARAILDMYDAIVQRQSHLPPDFHIQYPAYGPASLMEEYLKNLPDDVLNDWKTRRVFDVDSGWFRNFCRDLAYRYTPQAIHPLTGRPLRKF